MPSIPSDWAAHLDLDKSRCEPVVGQFDKPTRIEKGSDATEFSYGLGNRRYKRVDDNAVDQQKTTWTVGSVEWIEDGTTTYFKRYIGGMAIIDYYPASGASNPWYLTRDHLGSIHSISNADGDKVHESHFGDTYSLSRVFADSVAGGINAEIYGDSFEDGLLSAALTSFATYTNVRLRARQYARSSQFPGQIGESGGFRGIPGKLAGERINESIWLTSGAAEAYAAGMSHEVVLAIYEKAKTLEGNLSPLGCLQGGQGCVFGFGYKPGGLFDYVLEGYAGVHDTLNQPFFYKANGTLSLVSNPILKGVRTIINVSNVFIATSIVIPSLIPDHVRHLFLTAEAK